jgi:hypothetical protein
LVAIAYIPNDRKDKFRKLSKSLSDKNFYISEIRKFDTNTGRSKSTGYIHFNSSERKYIMDISKIVNTYKFKDKINLSEASIIFFLLTNYNNFINDSKERDKSYTNIENLKNKYFFNIKKETFSIKNIHNKMNLILFIKSFELIAIKIFPNMILDEAFKNLMKEKIYPFISRQNIYRINSNGMQNILKKMNEKNIHNFLSQLSDVIQPLFYYFTVHETTMKFYQFFEFYRHFELIPELISLSQLKIIFFSLCESETSENNQAKTEEINFHLFLKSLGMTSMLSILKILYQI